jgi:REP element-mobilizing transposase RayT
MILGGGPSGGKPRSQEEPAMARPLRIEFPGACYHVIQRGNFRFPVFGEERDRDLLLEKLAEFAERFRVRVRAYCVMVNHVHLYLQTEEANLSRFMQSFLTSFTVSYNLRHGSGGHVFQGRFKAYVVEEDSAYRDRVTRYIHLNPACIPSLREAHVEVRQAAIRDEAWSSYAAVIGLRSCPTWLDRVAVLAGFPGALAAKQKAYGAYVEQGLTEEFWEPATAAAAQTVIGSDRFVDRLRRGLTELSENLNLRREAGQHRALQAWVSLDDVLAAVARQYDCQPADLLRRHRRGDEARQVLLYLAAVCCHGRYSLTDLGQRLGGITVGAVCAGRYRLARRLAREQGLAARVRALQRELAGNVKV